MTRQTLTATAHARASPCQLPGAPRRSGSSSGTSHPRPFPCPARLRARGYGPLAPGRRGPQSWHRACDFASEAVTEKEPSVADGPSTSHGFSLYLCPLHMFTHTRVARNVLAASKCEACVCTWGRLRRKPVSLRGLPLHCCLQCPSCSKCCFVC